MGLFDEIIKDVANEAKYALKDELRSEVRSETRQAVRDTIQGTKQGIGQASQAVKDGISGQGTQQPNVMSAAPAAPVEAAPAPTSIEVAPVEAAPVTPAAGSSENLGEALANATDQAAPAAQAFNNILNSDSALGKIANAFVDAKMTEEQKAEMKEGLKQLSDPAKVEEAKRAMIENSDKIEETLKEQGVNTEELKNTLDQNS